MVQHKTFGPAQTIFGLAEGPGITITKSVIRIHFWSLFKKKVLRFYVFVFNFPLSIGMIFLSCTSFWCYLPFKAKSSNWIKYYMLKVIPHLTPNSVLLKSSSGTKLSVKSFLFSIDHRGARKMNFFYYRGCVNLNIKVTPI